MRSLHAVLLLLLAVAEGACKIRPAGLRVNDQEGGAYTEDLVVLGWRIEGEQGGESGFQGAYQVEGGGWSTGKVVSNNTLGIRYGGKPVRGVRVLWTVTIWDSTGSLCPSQSSWFEYGTLGDWGAAQWISRGPPSPPRNECVAFADNPTPLLRWDFTITTPKQGVRVYVSGLGYYRLWVDGERMGDALLDPALSSYRKRVFYRVHPVGVLTPGRHSLALELGNGYWNPAPLYFWGRVNLRESMAVGEPMGIVSMEADGGEVLAVTGSDWVVGSGATRFNNIYLGERYDATKERRGWEVEPVEQLGWDRAVVVDQGVGKLEVQPIPPVRRVERLPVSVVRSWEEGGNTVHLLDTGKNHAGTCNFTLAGRGTVRVLYGELLYPNQTLNCMTSVAGQIKGHNPAHPCEPDIAYQQDVVTLRGDGNHTVWEPGWSYHGFRYLQMYLPPGAHHIATVCYSIRSDIPLVSSNFSCSDHRVEALRTLHRNTFDSNLPSIQTDCAQRERFGYGGDAVATGDAAIQIYDMAAFYRKRVVDFADEQRGNGGYTETAPYVGVADGGLGGGAGPIGWEVFVPDALLWLYRYYGNREVLESMYNSTTRFVNLLRTNPPGVLSGLGDWMPLEATPVAFTGRGFLYSAYKNMATISDILGKPSQVYRDLAQAVADEVNNLFLDRTSGTYGNHTHAERFNATQTAQAMALSMGIAPPEVADKVRRVLVDGIRNAQYVKGKGQGPPLGGGGPHMLTGIFGLKWVMGCSPDGDLGEAVYEALVSPTYPSLLWMTNNPYANATTLWESWFFSDSTYSHNHPMFAAGEEWVIHTLAGIAPAPHTRGMQQMVFRPRPPKAMAPATLSLTLHTVRGPVIIAWTLTSTTLKGNITLPPNTVTTLDLPSRPPTSLPGGFHSYAVPY